MQNRSQYISFCVFLFLLCSASACAAQDRISVGAERQNLYLELLLKKNVGLVVNHSSVVGSTHLVDTLTKSGIKIKSIFAPEHGFRGDHADGDEIASGLDKKTGIAIVSLYGKHKKPTPADLKGIDLMVFDIQDVGARFYTYLSTLHYVMEACAENNIPLIVFDRPNPNGFYVDGPVLDTSCCSSFIGMHPVPVVYGMTIGEYARMINGEGWLAGTDTCNLTVIPLSNYTHQSLYRLPVWPSPNLASMEAIYLYPSICFFEGTNVSLGRGTERPFEVIGAPWFKSGDYSFTPQPVKGKSDKPPLQGQLCIGYDLHVDGKNVPVLREGIILDWLVKFYGECPDKSAFFTSYFEKLAGTRELSAQIKKGISADLIKESWQPELQKFLSLRKKYLLYP